MRISLPIWLAACNPAHISGSVIDSSGQVLEGVTVRIAGTEFQVQTDLKGQFALDYAPGDLIITIEHPNYFERVHSVRLVESKPHALKPTVLVQKPMNDGLFVVNDTAVVTLNPGRLTRDTQRTGAAKKRRFCLNRGDSKPNTLPAGTARFADKNAQPWRLFKLDNEGCAYRDAKDKKGRWVVEYRERPDMLNMSQVDGIALHDVQLDKGEYFIADWSGFFVSDPADKGHYTGRWLRVDD